MQKVLIAGVSTRAAAESAARAGFAVTAIDAFGDLDQHPSVRSLSLAREFSARAAAIAARDVECDAVVYLSSFENHPRAMATLAEGRALWGNSPETVRRVRDPRLLVDALRRRGFSAPEVRLKPLSTVRLKPDTTYANPTNAEPYVNTEPYVVSGFSRTDPYVVSGFRGTDPYVVSGFSRTDPYVVSGFSRTDPYVVSGFSRTVDQWLVKPLSSGGGQRIRLWDGATRLPRGCYLQEFIDGPSGSVVFVAAGGHAVTLAVSRQLVGEPAFGTEGFAYCGNILTAPGDPAFSNDEALVEASSALAQAVVEEFGLVGVNGIDFIARDGRPWAIEVNPRWCASMELVERAYGVSVFEAHASACTSGRLPDFDLVRARHGVSVAGKAVLYARRDVTIGDTRTWLTKDESIRDIPKPGERISSGRPVCTIFADAVDSPTCHDALVERAGRVYAQLEAWCA